MELAEADPKGLVRESYLIEGITPGECRSIFMDWALSIPVGRSVPDAVRVLIATYALPEPGQASNVPPALTSPRATQPARCDLRLVSPSATSS